ncbi:putative BOI-related E3 ubiquitin-protein ligase 3 [Zea mays]|jgi:E3 ubiquitin-protein ligase BOI and related proteins|uniref:Putative BOI-related E3 ubiquitin-protein ligase 3 n=1 Tax=Zea mays TaxID=4577 RepID=A0A3L6F2X5_MAIZE|nr:putative BOI-related E3 ubiquitin-protein ligase 3 [Zea mays]
MAVQAQFGGLLLPPYAVEDQMRALKDYGVLLSAAQSELTCNVVGGGGAAAMPLPSRKRRRREDEHRHYNVNLPLPGMGSLAADPTAAASTSGRAPADAQVDALVRAECEQLRAGLEAARARQRRALLTRAAASVLARRAREAEARLEAARRRAAELDERVRLAAAEAQAWCGVARANEAVAAGMRATLDALLLRSSAVAAAAAGREGDSSEPEDAQSRCSCCYVEDVEATGTAAATASPLWNGRWACRACGEGEASVLLLPCRHMCLCKACEPRTDACPVCSGAKNASIHIAPS